jgi:disulfide oxidoreductase YuzD
MNIKRAIFALYTVTIDVNADVGGVGMEKHEDKWVHVRIFAFPMEGCDESKTWKAASRELIKRLKARYGNRVQAEFIEIFSPESFNYPEILEMIKTEQATPPIVTVDGDIVQSGGKISERIIRESLDELGIIPETDG